MTTQTPTTYKKDHQTASFLFLPFVVDVFSRRGIPLKRSPMMQVGNPDALTAEVVEAMRQILPGGVTAFLCRHQGWRGLSYAQPNRDNPRKRTRVFHSVVWDDVPLSFSDESIDSLLLGYNALVRASGQPHAGDLNNKRAKANTYYPTSKRLNFAHNGDIFVHHMLYLKMRDAPFRVDQNYWKFLTHDPLSILAGLDEPYIKGAHARLMKPDMQALWPWVGMHLAQSWHKALQTRWDNLERFNRLNLGLVTLCDTILAWSVEHDRRDTLTPLLHFFAQHLPATEEDAQQWINEFNQLVSKLKIADRQQYMRTWAKWLDTAWAVHQAYGDARDVHPVDREAPDKVFMETYEDLAFEDTAFIFHAIAKRLNAVIS